MLLKKGIVRKTFLFSALLIFFVVLISFAAMYFVMPGYYLTQKEKTLRANLRSLTGNLQAAATEEECAALISGFSMRNNVDVLSFDKNNFLLPAVSTPFLGMRSSDAVFMAGKQQSGHDGTQTYLIQIKGERNPESTPETGLSVRWASMRNAADAISVGSVVGTDIVDHVFVSGTLQPIDEARGVILSLIPYVLMLAIFAGLILSGIYARQLSKPILQISGAALRMQRMEPDAASGIKTKDELGQLSANLDALYANLRENIEHLQNEMDKVNRLERSKTEMVQSASHELKTPITALGGMLEGMIDNVGIYKDKDKYLVECKNLVDKLSHLVGEILGASRADVSGDELECSDVFADGEVERAIAENAYQIREKGLRVEQELPATLISTDPSILRHAISNLISNAVRYTPQNGVIRISITGEGRERRLSIENECEPILPEELPKLFEPFYTRSYSRDKTKSGTGLGLYIVKRSLERLMIPYEAAVTELGFKISLMI